jgi:hypothetical protein
MRAAKEHIDTSNVVLQFIDTYYIYKDEDLTENDIKELKEPNYGNSKIKARDLYNDFKRRFPKENLAENVFAARLSEIGIKKEEIKKLSYRIRLRSKTYDELHPNNEIDEYSLSDSEPFIRVIFDKISSFFLNMFHNFSIKHIIIHPWRSFIHSIFINFFF